MTIRRNMGRNAVQLSLPPESCVGWTYQQCGAARDRSACLQRPWFPDSWKDRAVSSGIHSRPPESQPAAEGKQQEVAFGRFPPQQSPGDGGDALHLRSFLVPIILTLPFFLLINGYHSYLPPQNWPYWQEPSLLHYPHKCKHPNWKQPFLQIYSTYIISK